MNTPLYIYIETKEEEKMFKDLREELYACMYVVSTNQH